MYTESEAFRPLRLPCDREEGRPFSPAVGTNQVWLRERMFSTVFSVMATVWKKLITRLFFEIPPSWVISSV